MCLAGCDIEQQLGANEQSECVRSVSVVKPVGRPHQNRTWGANKPCDKRKVFLWLVNKYVSIVFMLIMIKNETILRIKKNL